MPATTPTVTRPVVSAATKKLAYAKAIEAETVTTYGSWVRLASVASMSGGESYHVALRKLKTGECQFGCSCKDWIFRRQKTGEMCKHQMAYVAGGATNGTDSGKVKVWYSKAGTAALAAFCQKH